MSMHNVVNMLTELKTKMDRKVLVVFFFFFLSFSVWLLHIQN